MVDHNPDFQKLKQTYPVLSTVFEKFWTTQLDEFASHLYQKNPVSLEKELLESITEELSSMSIEKTQIKQVVDQLIQVPVLQTAHHITPTNGPTFLTIDIISLAGLKPDQPYLVAANSGVAFSNSAWTGALSYESLNTSQIFPVTSSAYRNALKSSHEREQHGETEKRVSLVPSRQRDQLVFNTELTEYQQNLYLQFNQEVKNRVGPMDPNQPFSYWAIQSCRRIQEEIFSRYNIVIFDINRIICRYLAKILSKEVTHPVHELFFNTKTSNEILNIFQQPSMFLTSYKGKKSYKVEPLYWKSTGLDGEKVGYKKVNRQDLIEALANFDLCPGLFLTFFVLRFLNGIRCLGSFNQIGYLEAFRKKWAALGLNWPLDLKSDYMHSLTTGRLTLDGKLLWPLDLSMRGETLNMKRFSNLPMHIFWEPILKQLI